MNQYFTNGVITLLAIVLGVAIVSKAEASPWSRGNNHFFINTSTEYFIANGNFLASTPGQEIDAYNRIETKTYGEFGISNRLMIGGTVVYGSSTVSNLIEKRSASGFSQIEGFVQHQLWTGKKGVGAIQIVGAVPTWFNTSVRTGLESDGAGIEGRFLYGRTLLSGKIKAFTTLSTGYRVRMGNAADFGSIDVSLGIEPTQKFLVCLNSFNSMSMRNAESKGTDFDVFKASPSLVWKISKRWSLQGGAVFEYAGRNIDRGNTYFLGMWTSF